MSSTDTSARETYAYKSGLITRYLFYLTPSEREIVKAHMQTKLCTGCKNRRYERTHCEVCNGVGKMTTLSFTEKLNEVVARIENELVPEFG